MTRITRMSRRRRKRIIIAYTLRTIVALFFITCITLMVCGCLYIHEHLSSGSSKVHAADISWIEQSSNTISEAITESNDTNGYIIVLDAGHGGKDQGTCNGNVLEKDINLNVAVEMRQILEEQGFTVIMTRDNDVFIELEDRSYIANTSNVDLFISIHCNYCKESSEVTGLECYYFTDTSSGQRYANSMIDYLNQYTQLDVRGAKPANFSVLRNTQSPAVLVELGYLSNKGECQKLNEANYQSELSHKLADAVMYMF